MGRILLLEDNPDMLSALIELFELNNHLVVTGQSGRDGLDELSNNQEFDLIISDISMPYMDGLTFLQEVRKNATWENIPITIMSGHVNDKQIAIKAGANAFISKPFRIADLHNLLDQYL